MTKHDSELIRAVLRQLAMWGVGAFMLLALLVVDLVHGWIAPETRELRIEVLGYENGRILQLVEPTSGPGLQAIWTAEITRDGELICAGSGVGDYTPRIVPLRFTPSQWVGDACGPLLTGVEHQASASWQWLDERGRPQTLLRAFVFVPEPGPISGL